MPGAGAPPGPVVRIDLACGQYALAVPPPGTALPAAAARDAIWELTGACPAQAPGAPVTVARAAHIRDELGPAVLVAGSARAVLYCPRGDITTAAAAALSALASAAPGLAGPVAGPVRVRIARAPHQALPACLHPAFAASTPGSGSGQAQVTAHVCEHLISAGLAAALTMLCTAYAGPRPAPAARPGA